MFKAMNESNPEVGSSQNINDGLVKTSEAKVRRFLSPPDMPLDSIGFPIIVF